MLMLSGERYRGRVNVIRGKGELWSLFYTRTQRERESRR